MIDIVDLRKSFNDQAVLKGLTLTIADGELLVIIGRSGGGKSVLLKHLMGLFKPDGGRVVINGVNVPDLRGRALEDLRAKFGVVFQGNALFDSLTVFDNVAFPLRERTRLPADVIRARVLEKLEQVGLAGAEDKLPAEISGGMRKRVAMARALVTEPQIVFLDEPTTGLDPILCTTIHELIRDLHRQLRFTAVMASHEIPDIFAIAHRVAMLYDGVIVETGSPGEIQASRNPVVRQFIQGDTEGPIQVV